MIERGATPGRNLVRNHMEQSEVLENELLEKVAKILGVAPAATKNFSEEAVVNYFNTFYDNPPTA